MGKQGNRPRAIASVLAASVAAALALSLLGGTASARTITHQTSFVFDTVSTGPTTVQYSGHVGGARICREKRTVDIYVGGVLLTTVVTDAGGNFSATGVKPPPGTEATAVLRKVVKKTKRYQAHLPR